VTGARSPAASELTTTHLADADDRSSSRAGPRTLPGLAAYFLRLGSSGFGEPIALVGYMQRDLVEQRHWFTEAEYRQDLALAQTMPGPDHWPHSWQCGLVTSSA
jgi:hypothetical protein